MGVTGCAEIFMRLSIMFVCSTSLCRGLWDRKINDPESSRSPRACGPAAVLQLAYAPTEEAKLFCYTVRCK